ncbi:unnamed protein product, partial [marine sediment metagenome]
NCLGTQCPHHEECFYYRARRRVRRAQILVVNHALFFSDLALRRVGASILPDYQVAVLDEAHMLESVAGDHLGVRVTSGQVEYQLNKLYNEVRNKGLLVHHKCAEGQRAVMECRLASDDFFGRLEEWRQTAGPKNGRVNAASVVENPLSPHLVHLARLVKSFAGKLSQESDRLDLTSAHDRLTALAEGVEQWRTQALDDLVYWTDVRHNRRSKSNMALHAAPIDVGPALRAELFERVGTVVLTSATLAVGKQTSFDFFRS